MPSITWETGDTSATIEHLCAGSYSVTLTDETGCSQAFSFDLTEPTALSANFEVIPEVEGMANGAISIFPVGGTPPYTYLWSTGDTTQHLIQMSAGTYSVTITDANNCILVVADTIPIYNCTSPIFYALIDSTQCASSCNGRIELVFNNGNVSNYTFEWSNGQTSSTAWNLCAGTYHVTITDSIGCTFINSFQVHEPEPLVAFLHTTPTMPGAASGTAWVTPMGGTPPYTYLWSTGDTTQMINGLGEGSYQCYVFDANQCFILQFFQIVACNPIEADAELMPPTCTGNCDGQIALSVTSPNALPIFEWEELNDTGPAVSGLCAGTYHVVITDSLTGCQTEYSYELPDPTPLSIQIENTQSPTSTQGGSIDITVSGGSEGYQYMWIDSSGMIISYGEDVDHLEPGCYMLVVHDLNGCSADTTICLEAVTATTSIPTTRHNIRIYPNPFTQSFYIYTDTPYDSEPAFKIYNALGQEHAIQSKRLTAQQWHIEVTDGRSGMYFLQLIWPDQYTLTIPVMRQ